jgi:hypothetical protein
MIDYKLVLILVLSIVLLYLYNRVESLKDELKKQKKEQDEQKNILKKLEIENANIKKQIENLEKSILNKTNNLNIAKAKVNVNSNIVENINEKKDESIECTDGICKMPEKESINKLNISLMNEKNTTEYSATENDSESDSITISTDNVVLYSNDKSDKSDNDLQKLNEHVNEELNEDNIEIEFIENIEIANDLEKDNQINLGDNNLEEIINVESLIDKLGDEAIIFNKTINLDLNANPSDYIEIIDSSNSIEDENNLNLNIQSKDIIKSYSDLDYENENNNSSANSKSVLEDLNKYKLNELQSLAKEHNIEITTLKNGKIKNKTKKELYTELVKIN